MPTVFASKRSHYALLFLKGSVLAGAILALILATDRAQYATLQPTVTTEIELNLQPATASIASAGPRASQGREGITGTDNYPTQTQTAAALAAENATLDDTYISQQWSLQNNPEIAGASGLFGSYDYLTASHNIVVAVVDSGVVLQHEDLNFLPGYDFIHNPAVSNDGDGRDHDPGDPGDWVNSEDVSQESVNEGCPIGASKWHGTAIAGIIGATPYNATGIAGGSPLVSMLPVRVTGKCGGYVSDLIDGIRWAAGLEVRGVATNPHPADVINLSVGFPGGCSNAMQQAINDAAATGATLVTAATNSAANLDVEPYSPASCNNVLTVSATDRNGAITSYTALGKSVFISAPGGTVTDGIITTQNDGLYFPLPSSSYGYHYGTSIAAAHVSAAIANMLTYNADLTRDQIKQVLSASAKSIDNDTNCANRKCGVGRLDAVAALELLATDNFLQDSPTDPETGQATPVQLAATGGPAVAIEPVVTTTSSDDVWAGSTDWRSLLLLLLLCIGSLLQRRATLQTQ